MDKGITTVDQARKKLVEKFASNRGAKTAFCREAGISGQWLRQHLSGARMDLDFLIRAADFVDAYAKRKLSEIAEKEAAFVRRVQALAA